MRRRLRGQGTPLALPHHLAGAAFATPAPGGHSQRALDTAEVQARVRLAGDIPVRDLMADANDHGRGEVIGLAVIINANESHLHDRYPKSRFRPSRPLRASQAASPICDCR